MKPQGIIAQHKALIQRSTRFIFWSVLMVQLVMILCIPLMHMMNDSGWYYMNVHFMQTGEYRNESMYPSFHSPSQYYPLLGYSGFLGIGHSLADLLGIPPFLLIKCFQLFIYILTSLMLAGLARGWTGSKTIGDLMGLLFLLYYPNLVFTHFLMSETLASFLLIGSLYGYALCSQQRNTWACCIWSLSLGYMMLVKTVFLPVAVIFFFLMAYQVLSVKRQHWMALLPFFIFPLVQLGLNKQIFHNLKLQSGLGWHLWDRVIANDRLIPSSSPAYDSLKKTLALTNQRPDPGYWWGVTRQLSELGYTEEECQAITLQISLDAIREHPVRYIVNTVMESCRVLVYPNEVVVPPGLDAWQEQLQQFCNEPQHQPFCEQAKRQGGYATSWISGEMMTLHNRFAGVYNAIAPAFHHPLVIMAFLLSWILCLYRAIRYGLFEDGGMWLSGLLVLAVVFGSIMAEYPQSRLVQPAMPLIWLLPFVMAWNALKRYQGSDTRLIHGK